MKKIVFFACLLLNFFYLFLEGCTDPQDLITPTHFSRVPGVTNLQGSVGYTAGGRRQILVSWMYDTTSSNIRSWDVTRSIDDTAIAQFVALEIIRKPTSGYPFYVDSTASLQIFTTDSIEVYYRVIPNGNDNFAGKPSEIVHLIVRQTY